VIDKRFANGAVYRNPYISLAVTHNRI
jgi:hypothetical protein